MAQIKYLTDNLDELDAAEHDLEDNGIPRSHIHVLSNNPTALAQHDLPPYSDWSQRDITFFGFRGALIGITLCAAMLSIALLNGLNESIGWPTLLFMCIAIIGFCTWEGGLIGISKMNHHFSRYKNALKDGQHLLVVDTTGEEEEYTARHTVESHPVLRAVD